MQALVRALSLTRATGRSARVANLGRRDLARVRRALVVGGTKGIGGGIAVRLAQAGCGHVDIVGRDEAAAREVLRQIPTAESGDGFQSSDGFCSAAFIPADLGSIAGCHRLLDELQARGAPYELLVMTLGVWPDFTNPLNADGYNRVVFMDALARYAVLAGMLERRLLAHDGTVMSVLASGQAHQVGGATAAERRQFLAEEVFQRHTPTSGYAQTKVISRTLGTAGVAHDSMLQLFDKNLPGAAYPDLTVVGTFPGLVDTAVMESTLGSGWFTSLVRMVSRWTVTENVLTAGGRHCAVLAELLERGHSYATRYTTVQNCSFWDASSDTCTERTQPEMFTADEEYRAWLKRELDGAAALRA